MATYILVHGTWWGSWCWQQVARLLRHAGHEVYTPSLTGLGERVHLATPTTNLDTHIQDVVNTLTFEDLREAILVGWSYGGMVITGVAERVPDRVGHLDYLDAQVPSDGQSLADILGSEAMALVLERARTEGDGWRFGGTGGNPRSTPQPLKTWLQPLAVRNPAASALPRTYIYCLEKSSWTDPFKSAAKAALLRATTAAREAGWRYRELATAHTAMNTAPRELADLLLEIASEGQ